MEKYEELINEAMQKIKIADHMAVITYPLVRDPKILLSIIKNVFQGVESAMSSLLEYEKLYKNIPLYEDKFSVKLDIFKRNVAPRHKIDEKEINLVQHLKEIVSEHEKSPVEFNRKGKFVIVSNDTYSLRTLSVDDVRKEIAKAKNFVEKMSSLVKKNV